MNDIFQESQTKTKTKSKNKNKNNYFEHKLEKSKQNNQKIKWNLRRKISVQFFHLLAYTYAEDVDSAQVTFHNISTVFIPDQRQHMSS